MVQVKKYTAVDLRAESGRVMLGSVSDEKLILEEVGSDDFGVIFQTCHGYMGAEES